MGGSIAVSFCSITIASIRSCSQRGLLSGGASVIGGTLISRRWVGNGQFARNVGSVGVIETSPNRDNSFRFIHEVEQGSGLD
jgi:hypothetical protein